MMRRMVVPLACIALLLAAGCSASDRLHLAAGRQLRQGAGCQGNEYLDGATCMACAAGALAAPGATSASDCYCNSNTQYYDPNTGCTACTGTTTNGTSPVWDGASLTGKTCNCAVGYTSFNATTGTCTSCAAGFYRNASTLACDACASSGSLISFASTLGDASSQDACFCATAAGGPTPSPTEFYKPNAGCTACPNPAASTTGATVATASGQRTCECKAGFQSFSQDTLTCSVKPCTTDPGQYRPVGSATCKDCPQNPNTAAPRTLSQPESANITTEKACYCQPGGTHFYKPGFGCFPCGAGTQRANDEGTRCKCMQFYKDFNAATGTCTLFKCPTGNYLNADTNTCTPCSGLAAKDKPMVKVPTIGEGACYCIANKAKPNYYKPSVGCTKCGTGATFNAGGKVCDCLPGYVRFDPATGSCTDVATAQAACLAAGNKYLAGSDCSECVAGSTSNAGASCTCTDTALSWDKASNTCKAPPAAPTCLAKNAACVSGAAPSCCGGATCKKTGTKWSCK